MQPLLLKRYRELEEARLQPLAGRAQAGAGGAAAPGRREPTDGGRAPPGAPAALRAGQRRGVERAAGEVAQHGFNQRPRFEQVVGYLERNEPLLDQPDRKATSFVTSHFYLDDFAQSSKDPNPRPLPSAEATDEDVRLARRWQGYGGTRFVEDDLAGDPEAGALASNGQGPPPSRTICAAVQTARRRQRTSHRRRALGLAAAQAFRSQLPQPPPQIIGQPNDVERLLGAARAGGGARRGAGC